MAQHAAQHDIQSVPDGPTTDIGRVMALRGLASPQRIALAELRARKTKKSAPDILRRTLGLPQKTIAEINAHMGGFGLVDPVAHPPDARLIDKLGAKTCLRMGILPWRTISGTVVILTAHPDRAHRQIHALGTVYGPIRLALTEEEKLHRALRSIADMELITTAEAMVPTGESCRNWNTAAAQLWALGLLACLMISATVFPKETFFGLFMFALLVMTANLALKAAAIAALLRPNPRPARPDPTLARTLPIVTVFVPMFRESEIAAHLIQRLTALDYPRELLDVCLLLEADDLMTRQAVAKTSIPRWMRAIVVPTGTLKTKPRALNFGLGFARGAIIGIYDAEDAPAPDQIRRVVDRFHTAPRDVACLQGQLDFYNPTHNWIARCFTLEYASWFRVILPGLERLGLVIPLGGTTLFLKRAVIEKLGGWDAHNVTEDADLGIRLARHGYRTELIDITTMEEANCRPWAWVKQRSRWLKGYAITYGVAMRQPRQLRAQLGARRFWALQIQFLGAILHFTLAPLIWTGWAIPFGLWHPATEFLPAAGLWVVYAVMIISELTNLVAAYFGAKASGRPRLAFWAPTLQAYFPLGTLAMYKALFELVTRPFYWDKTSHGAFS